LLQRDTLKYYKAHRVSQTREETCSSIGLDIGYGLHEVGGFFLHHGVFARGRVYFGYANRQIPKAL